MGVVLEYFSDPSDYVFMKKLRKNRSTLALGSKVGFNT